jgi:Fur family zinc uptake transcriptional regulator
MLDKNIAETLRLIKKSCQQNDLNFTIKRSNVMQLMLVEEKSLSAYDIVDAYHIQFRQKISPVSVYRMLDFLIEAQLIHKLSSNGQYIACSHITGSHSHEIFMLLICNSCHQVEEVEIDNGLPPTLAKSMAHTGFQLKDKQLELQGICLACQN